MKKIFNSIVFELKYLVYSKVLFVTILALIGVVGVNCFFSLREIDDANKVYQDSYQWYEENGEDVEKALKTEATVTKESDGHGGVTTSIDNVLRYDYDEYCRQLYVNGPSYSMWNILEKNSFIFFPLIFALFAAYLANYDKTNKTTKLRLTREKSSTVWLGKMIFIVSFTAVVHILVVFVSYVVNYVFYYFKVSNINIKQFFYDSSIVNNYSLLEAFTFSVFLSLLYALIGFAIGLLIRKASVTVAVILIYHLMIPNLGKYDLKNVILELGGKLFPLRGNGSLYAGIDIKSYYGIIICFIYGILFTFVAYLKYEKESKYSM